MAMVEENPIVDELILKSCMETTGDELGLKAESNWFLSIFEPTRTKEPSFIILLKCQNNYGEGWGNKATYNMCKICRVSTVIFKFCHMKHILKDEEYNAHFCCTVPIFCDRPVNMMICRGATFFFF